MKQGGGRHGLVLAVVLAWSLAAGAACAQDAGGLRVEVVSGPAHLVSGGAARLAVYLPDGTAPGDVTVAVNGTPAAGFAPADRTGRVLDGVVRGLRNGENTVVVRAGRAEASVTLVGYPSAGPMFSGPRQQPFACATEADRKKALLGDVLDADCTIGTRVGFVYRSRANGRFKTYWPGAPRPDDLSQTTTSDGRVVDYIVRWERGTINRFIYSIAVLSPEGQDSAAVDRSAWNGKLVYAFEGGVGIGRYQGAPSPGQMLYRPALDKGYAVVYSTGTRTDTHYNLVVGGETAIMVKSRFVTAYGRPRYTVGVGGSGGGLQQYVYGQNHPGLLDAAIPQYAYPDMVTQTIHVGDCELLERYMDAEVRRDPASKWATWTNRSWLEGMNASDTLANPYRGGLPGLTECINGWRGLIPLALNPRFGTAPGLSPEQRAAVHWTHAEDLAGVLGRGEDGYARRAWDNVGVQYGLLALRRGQITPEEFLDLNARVGSWKDESEMVPEGLPFDEDGDGFDPHSARNMNLSPDDRGDPPAPRAAADPGAVDSLFRHGLVFTGKIDLPVVDWRHYLEPFLDMHNSHQSFATRRRMLDHDGDAANQVVWFTAARSMKTRHDQTPLAFEVVDEWMANLRAHPERGVAANRPARAVDSCFDADGALLYAGADAWAGVLDDAPPGPCTRRFPLYGTSRTVAGGPLTGDVFTCALQPVDQAVAAGLYGDWTPTPDQLQRLKAIFPTGVCDYTKGEAGR